MDENYPEFREIVKKSFIKAKEDINELENDIKNLYLKFRFFLCVFFFFFCDLFNFIFSAILVARKMADICDIDYLFYFKAGVFKRPPQNISEDISAHISNMGEKIYRRATRVNT